MSKPLNCLLGALLVTALLSPAAAPQPGRTLLRKDTRWVDSPGVQEYPNAPALILYDDIGFSLYPDGSTAYREYDVVKVLTGEGVEAHQSLVRVYRRGFSEIKLEEARTIGPDQQVHDLDPKAISDTALIPNSKVYADYRRYEFEFPGVVPGAITEYRLTTTRKAHPENAWWATSYVQNPEPLLVSIFTVEAPLGRELRWAAPGLIPGRPTRSEKDGKQILRWEVAAQGALRTEPAMPEAESLLRRIDLSSFGSWSELGGWFFGHWQQAVKANGRLGLVTSGLLPTGGTPRARAQSILDYLAGTKKQVDLSYEQFLPNPASALLDEAVLSYLDTAVLASAMLDFAGFRSQPVLAFSEPRAELERDLPMPTTVSRVLLYLPDVGGQPFWFDPAHPGQLRDGPPAGYQGRAALFLGPEIRLADMGVDAFDLNRDETRIEARIDEEGSAELSISKLQFGEAALFLREAVRSLATAERARRDTILRSLFAAMAQSYSPLAQVHERYFPDKEPAAGGGFPLGLTLIVPDYAAVEGDKRQVSVPIQLDQRITQLVDSPPDREHALQFDHPFRDDSQVHLLLPEGSQIVSMPETVQVDNPYASFLLTSRQEGREAWFYSRLVVKQAWIPVEAYDQVLEVARKVAQAANTPLVYQPGPDADE